jgi:hypothetical protein
MNRIHSAHINTVIRVNFTVVLVKTNNSHTEIQSENLMQIVRPVRREENTLPVIARAARAETRCVVQKANNLYIPIHTAFYLQHIPSKYMNIYREAIRGMR